MKTVLVLTIAATAAATPALADPLPSASNAAPIEMSAPDTGKRYCMVVPGRTGSFINRKVCRTQAEWAKDGVNPLVLRK